MDKPVAEFLARHADRLVSETPFRGLWICEDEGGTPLMALTVYTEPHLRMAVIADESLKRPFKSLYLIASKFEEWCTENKLTHYGIVVPERDDWYARIIEKRGAIEIGRSDGWIEYLHQIDKNPTTEDGIHPWTPADWRRLRALMQAFLTEHCSAGGDFLPTRNNVETFIRQGVRGAAKGDPCLIAVQNGKPIGFCLWTAIDVPVLDLRERICHGFGTYVIPEFRRQGWSRRIRARALELAKEAGYDRVEGVALDKRGLASGKDAGFTVSGIHVRKKLGE